MKGKPLIGFVGQGFVGGSYADDFEKRGFSVVRYSLEPKYLKNKEAIGACDIVLICVPTPSTPKGFDASVVEEGIRLVGKGKVAVIKSTVVPGTTRALQNKSRAITILFSPEFLNAATAAHDAAHPFSNIVGIPKNDAKHRAAAKVVHSILPKAGFSHTCTSEEAEIYKYAHNVSGVMQVLTYNLMYDVAKSLGAKWDAILPALEADPMVSNWYIRPVHKSGRGAGGPCFIKDLAAFARFYRRLVGTPEGVALLNAAEKKNVMLLTSTKKDLELLSGVYGKGVLKKGTRGKKR